MVKMHFLFFVFYHFANFFINLDYFDIKCKQLEFKTAKVCSEYNKLDIKDIHSKTNHGIVRSII